MHCVDTRIPDTSMQCVWPLPQKMLCSECGKANHRCDFQSLAHAKMLPQNIFLFRSEGVHVCLRMTAFKLPCMNVGIGWGRQDAGHGIWAPDQENSSGYQARSSDSHDQVRLVYMFCAIWEFAQSGDCVAHSIPISRLHNLRMHTIVDIEDS